MHKLNNKRFYEEYLDSAFRVFDDDDTFTGQVEVEKMSDIIAVLKALCDTVGTQYGLTIRAGDKETGFAVNINGGIFSEWRCDTNTIMQNSKEKIAQAVKLLGEI